MPTDSDTAPPRAAAPVAFPVPFNTTPGIASLGERFFTRLAPTPLPSPYPVSYTHLTLPTTF